MISFAHILFPVGFFSYSSKVHGKSTLKYFFHTCMSFHVNGILWWKIEFFLASVTYKWSFGLKACSHRVQGFFSSCCFLWIQQIEVYHVKMPFLHTTQTSRQMYEYTLKIVHRYPINSASPPEVSWNMKTQNLHHKVW